MSSEYEIMYTSFFRLLNMNGIWLCSDSYMVVRASFGIVSCIKRESYLELFTLFHAIYPRVNKAHPSIYSCSLIPADDVHSGTLRHTA